MLSFGEKKLQELNEESGETTWHVIAKNGDIEIIQKKYFDLDEREINFKNKEGLTPFAIAIEKNNLEMVKELTKCGAKNSKEDILTLTKTAIEANNLEMVKELLKNVDKDSKEDILKFIRIAIENNNRDIEIYLIAIYKKSSDLNPKRKIEEAFVDGAGMVNSLEEGKGKSVTDAPSYKPSGARNISVTALLNHEEVASKNGSGSRS